MKFKNCQIKDYFNATNFCVFFEFLKTLFSDQHFNICFNNELLFSSYSPGGSCPKCNIVSATTLEKMAGVAKKVNFCLNFIIKQYNSNCFSLK